MRGRAIGAAMLLVGLAACGGGPSATSSTTSGPAGATSGPGATASAPPASAGGGTIDLSALDACTLLDLAAVEALTGETGFDAQRSDGGPSGDKCFWAVTRPGVPQYVEITVARTNGLLPFNFAASAGCTEIPVSAAGVDAAGADCTSPQHKVQLRAWSSGVQVDVLVNEPKATLTPQQLADTAQAVFDAMQ